MNNEIWEPNEREEMWLDSHKQICTYEISIWTLQDDFITVLKPANIKNKGQIQEGKAKFNIDGTQELTFTIPMYLYDYTNNVLVENPIWYNTQNGNIAIDMRKIKLIFNKEQQFEKVYEFLITKIEESHSNDKLFCNVTCEGLAFHELGKIGYKISLSSEDLENDWKDYDENGSWIDSNGISYSEEPKATIQYWLNKFLSPSYISPNKWYYDIQMNYDAYSSIPGGRDSSIIYEEAYPASWKVSEGKLSVVRYEECKEKERSQINLEESNMYNLTQDLAKTFEVFCRYEYTHDSNYHITGKKIIFYNNFIYENEGYIDFTYPYSTAEISREMDSTDLITKMFVKSIEDDTTASGLLTIINTEANKSGEDYLLNFEYLHNIKAISEEQYKEVSQYEVRIKQLNMEIAPIESQIVSLSSQIPTLEAKLKIAINAIQLDTERIGAASDLLNAITEGDGEIEITAMNPATAILLKDSSDTTGKSYYINLSKHGIDANSIRIFRYFDITKDEPYSTGSYIDETDEIDNHNGRLYVELKTGYYEYDEFGDITRIRNLYLSTSNDNRKTVFLTYNYTPKLYYDRVINTWENRLAKDKEDRDRYNSELAAVKEDLENAEEIYKIKVDQKNEEIKQFEVVMGPALREGYWNPDDYNDFGDNYSDEIVLSSSPQTIDHRPVSNIGNSLLNYFIWDTELFNDEFNCERIAGIAAQELEKYPCIDLSRFVSTFSPSSSVSLEELKHRIENLSFFFCDYNGIKAYNEGTNLEAGKMRSFAVGSQCQYGFIKYNNVIKPVLILNGIETIPKEISISKTIVNVDANGNEQEITTTTSTQNMIEFLKSRSMKIGAIKIDNNNQTVFESWTQDVLASDWIDNGDYVSVYPRMVITSLAVKTSSNQLFVSYAKNKLTNIEDYYCLTKIPANEDEANYYITLKPETIFKLGGVTFLQSGAYKSIFGIRYVISNADTSIYLDAQKVLKENSQPRVSYQIKLSTLNKTFMQNAYDRLSYIAHINDPELKFENTMGYISQVELDLDKPWEDQIEIKNYKTKFEDLFSAIVASTEEMKKNEYILKTAASAFDAYGSIKPWVLEDSIYKVDLDYAFNQGNLTITEKDGIWGVSESGVVAFRGGGIFTATESDGNGNWKWNTGITPEGINATLITAGQLDTNRVMVYAGDKLRFQLNGEGLFAYKSFFEDLNTINSWTREQKEQNSSSMNIINNKLKNNDLSDLDATQFVKLDENGLFLIVKEGAMILNRDKTEYISIENSNTSMSIPKEGLKRVEISWNGLKLRNWNNEEVFWADPDTGNLNITGTITALAGIMGGWKLSNNKIYSVKENSDQIIYTSDEINSSYVALDSSPNGTYTIWAGNETAASAPFSVTRAGALSATSGMIGGWTLGANQLSSGTGAGFVALDSDISSTYAIWAGDGSAANAPFSVTRSGILHVTGANISGTIYGDTGIIGGWNLINSTSGNTTTKRLYSGSSTNYVAIDAGSVDSNSTLMPYVFWAGAENPEGNLEQSVPAAPFRVKRDGTVYLTKLKAIGEEIDPQTGSPVEVDVNLRNYPFWKLTSGNTVKTFTKSETGSEVTLTIGTTGNNLSVTFNKAVAGSLRLAGSGSQPSFSAEYIRDDSPSTILDQTYGYLYFSSQTYTETTTVNVGTADGSGMVASISLTKYWNTGYAAGWAAAKAAISRNGNVIMGPSDTVDAIETLYTANAEYTDTHSISFPASISLVPGQIFTGAAGNYVYKNNVNLIGNCVAYITWS